MIDLIWFVLVGKLQRDCNQKCKSWQSNKKTQRSKMHNQIHTSVLSVDIGQRHHSHIILPKTPSAHWYRPSITMEGGRSFLHGINKLMHHKQERLDTGHETCWLFSKSHTRNGSIFARMRAYANQFHNAKQVNTTCFPFPSCYLLLLI